ncbi:hypothetical protein [Clostridium sporogenes]|uniref:hypothetical protein n=1 Tax=Clostridium sporogenes TaxID=1509 RepID=UPI0013D48E1B|nr:hypothetical protein [Clostridium sporogenes]NFF75967.1 hypothetical protein [Clostridium sporogenes]NFH40864.1 hypothetical protein [Clostridium sporogenes]
MNIGSLMTILHSEKLKVDFDENVENKTKLDNTNWNKHKYGYDLESDLKELYGKDYESINEMRNVLFSSLENEPFEIKILRNIIQNPVPISKDELAIWLINKLNIYDKYNIKITTITNIEFIEKFAKKYHLKEVI